MDQAGNALTYGGVSWSAPALVDSGNRLVAVSCASSSFCNATDNHGQALTYNGTWMPTMITGNDNVPGVSCPTTSFCAAVDSEGNAILSNGSTWSAATLIDSGNGSFASVSCSGASFCAAVDVSGNALTFNGTSWSLPSMVDSSNTFTSVSCPSSSFCMAVDFEGYAVTYAPSSENGFRITSTSPLPAATRGHLYTDTLHAIGGYTPYKWKSIGRLPRGLRLHPTGILSGTPKAGDAPGTYTFTARAKTHRSRAHHVEITTMSFSITLS